MLTTMAKTLGSPREPTKDEFGVSPRAGRARRFSASIAADADGQKLRLLRQQSHGIAMAWESDSQRLLGRVFPDAGMLVGL